MPKPLNELTLYLESELQHSAIHDYPGAMNGLQLENDGACERIIAAVDATLPVIQKALEYGPGSLLIVHHGLFWQGAQCIRGSLYKKLKLAMEGNMAIFSSHLPLDLHVEWGNNCQFAQELGLSELQPWLLKKGVYMGVQGKWNGTRKALQDKIQTVTHVKPHVCFGGKEVIQTVGIITGGAGNEVYAAACDGVDAFITGEGSHWSYGAAEEEGINLYYAGHYATETFGVKAAAQHLSKYFELPWHWVDHPSGL